MPRRPRGAKRIIVGPDRSDALGPAVDALAKREAEAHRLVNRLEEISGVTRPEIDRMHLTGKMPEAWSGRKPKGKSQAGYSSKYAAGFKGISWERKPRK